MSLLSVARDGHSRLVVTATVTTTQLAVGFVSLLLACTRRSWLPLLKSRGPLDYLAEDGDDFESWGGELLRWITDYRKNCKKSHVISRVPHNYLIEGPMALPGSAPVEPEGYRSIMSDLDSKIVPGLTHWEASNKFFAYFKPHASYPAVLGELLCAGLNVMGFDWIASPACTELEVVVLDWLAKFLRLPSKFLSISEGPGGGVIQVRGRASERKEGACPSAAEAGKRGGWMGRERSERKEGAVPFCGGSGLLSERGEREEGASFCG
jgi:hypothetical protein